ncbi:MAG: putative Two-component system regulatory protein [Candidatus Eremiobacteraeota bacterium]|nr:putative Two-component system regulatory protein [Candidatus Eremiobacteraeota bacterium]
MEALTGSVEDLEWIAVEDGSAPGRVRRSAMAVARRLGFSEHRVGEVAIAATELATNLHRHAVEGAVLVRVRRDAGEAAVELVVVDGGPGVADLGAVARDGTSSAGTLGIGLGAAMRLSTWFDSHSVLGRGTVMVATFWPAAAPVARPIVAALTREMVGETVCGDACAQRRREGATTLMLADGLGHGELAAIAAREAVRAFIGETDAGAKPATTIRRLDGVLRSTRGAAVAIVELDASARTLTFAGVGNVAGWIDDGEQRKALVSNPGIVGNNAKTIREFETALPDGALVVLHSDGLTSKWDLRAYPGLRQRDPHLVAATLMRDAGVRHDDASVIVARAS